MNPNAKEFIPKSSEYANKDFHKPIDVPIKLGLRDYVDLQDQQAYCYLCFESMVIDQIADHLDGTYHKSLLKVTNNLLGKKEEPKVNFNNNIPGCQPSTSKDVASSILRREYRNLPKYDAIYADQLDEVMNNYMKGNFMEYRSGHNNPYCTLCDTDLIADMQMLTDHVDSVGHKIKVLLYVKVQKNVKKSTNYDTLPLEQYLISMEEMQIDSTPCYIVNKKIFIEFCSWTLMQKLRRNTVRCLVCEVTLENLVIMTHLNESKHKAFMESPVVKLEYEFIREIEPDRKFHCGICNKIEKGWSNVERHIVSMSHRRAKDNSDEMVAMLQPDSRDAMVKLLSLLKMLP